MMKGRRFTKDQLKVIEANAQPLSRADFIAAIDGLPVFGSKEHRESIIRNHKVNPRWFGYGTIEELLKDLGEVDG